MKKTGKNAVLIIIISIVAVIALLRILGFISIFANDKSKYLHTNKEFIKMRNIKEYPSEKMIMLTDYTMYKKYFDSIKIKKNDFENNNYILLVIEYPDCYTNGISPTSYKIDNETINVTVENERRCTCLGLNAGFYLLKVDKNTKVSEAQYDYKNVNDIDCNH